MFKSATVKLTLWYVLLSMALSLLFSGVLYHLATNELSEALHNQYQALATTDRDSSDLNHKPAAELDIRSQHLLRDLVYFNLLILIGSSLTSYILARRTLRPIELAHEAQLRFTAEASHELRTPLTAMKADTEATLMAEGNEVTALRRTLQGNLEDIDKLEKLTDHLLEISRYQSKAPRTLEVMDLDKVVREALKQFQKPITAQQLKLQADIAPAQVEGDPQSIMQLITIILDNAVKYSTPKGEISVKLSSGNKHVTVIIKDQVIGISPQDLPHIFERFYRSQAAKSRQDKVAGYGLGLPLAKEIVDLHGGSIEVHSREREGTEVVIKLPLFHN